ncbi:dimethylsulfonioproprionate lyase family protein [Pseudothauera rhizosphaerae]|uniref:Cupin domain-containing protein n=1 Tax=Pseudothauera rhizosphaerae TaxID=2565932 RepID=A0A4S4B2Z9_9RHOO|nr:dimethylsulfonioproprionate lyase family protein [Pseudothauera rhizosphaerae]THF65291.1 cupin domain-containing protein [Pseudothauera rhizosphaerae]
MSTYSLSHAAAAVQVLRRHLERRAPGDDALGHELAGILHHLREVGFGDGLAHGSGHPVAALLDGELPSRNGRVADVVAAFRPLFAALPWRYGYTPRPDFPGLETRMAWAELVGPLAPFRSDRACLGLTFIAPRTRYPEHFHPAVETYFVLSGTARWTAAGVTHERVPGDWVLHPSDIIHVMETGDEPLLAAYTWSGDIVSPSVYPQAAEVSYQPGN